MDPATLAALFAAVATVVSALAGSAALVLVKLRELRIEELRLELEWERLRRGIEAEVVAPPVGPGGRV